MKETVALSTLSPGERGAVCAVSPGKELYRRLLDIGFTENSIIECLRRAVPGDPTAYRVRGAVIALRREDADDISVRRV